MAKKIDYNKDIFAYRLREIMFYRDVSGLELYRRTGVAPPLISDYVNGKNLPGTAILINIAKALDVSVDYLLGVEGDVKDLAYDIKVLASHYKGASANEIQEKAQKIINMYQFEEEELD